RSPGSPGCSGSAPAVNVRPYLSTKELAQLTPWSVDAIEAKVRRGELRLGIHFFQPNGRGGERVWKWSAVVAHLEGNGAGSDDDARRGNLQNGRTFDVEKAT